MALCQHVCIWGEEKLLGSAREVTPCPKPKWLLPRRVDKMRQWKRKHSLSLHLLITGAYFLEATMLWVGRWRVDMWNWESWAHSFSPSDDSSLMHSQETRKMYASTELERDDSAVSGWASAPLFSHAKMIEGKWEWGFFSPQAQRWEAFIGHLLTYCWFFERFFLCVKAETH